MILGLRGVAERGKLGPAEGGDLGSVKGECGGGGKGGQEECRAAPGGQIRGLCSQYAMGLVFEKILEMRRLKIN